MESKVFLWEMDSVRNSERECQLASEALYRALLVDGNVVVMTFNQLADARWMLPILENEKDYSCLMQLFRMGAIRVSHYKDIRTASQYTQNALEKALNANGDFVFSGMPIKKEERDLQQEVLNAIRYCDPQRLWEKKEQLEQSGRAQEAKKVLLIYRYVKLILLVSQEKTKDNDAVENSTPYIDIMHALLQTDPNLPSVQEKPWADLFAEAVRRMRNMESKVENVNQRSSWYGQVDQQRETDPSIDKTLCEFQKLLADVCYNFTLESSANEVPCVFDDQKESVADVFVNRMNDYYQLYTEQIHCVDGPGNVQPKQKVDPDWSLVVEIREDMQKYGERRKKWHLAEKLKWPIKVAVTQVWLPIRNFLFYFVMFLLINIVVEKLSAGFELLPQINAWMSMDMGVMALIETVLFGVIGSLLSKWFAVPDILDIWSKLFHKIWNEIRFLAVSGSEEGKKHELRTNN